LALPIKCIYAYITSPNFHHHARFLGYNKHMPVKWWASWFWGFQDFLLFLSLKWKNKEDEFAMKENESIGKGFSLPSCQPSMGLFPWHLQPSERPQKTLKKSSDYLQIKKFIHHLILHNLNSLMVEVGFAWINREEKRK
jgi:hypothetical protein